MTCTTTHEVSARTSYRKYIGCPAQVGPVLVQKSRNRMQSMSAISSQPKHFLCNLRHLSKVPSHSQLYSARHHFVVQSLPLDAS